MLAKSWKKIGIIILIIACLIDIGCKIASKISFNDVITEIRTSLSEENADDKQNNQN